MEKEYLIAACTGQAIDIKKGQQITIIDVEGGQVADFFAENTADQNEFYRLQSQLIVMNPFV